MMRYYDKALIIEAKDFLQKSVGSPPNCAVVLGSGMSAIAESYEGLQSIDYNQIPNFPLSKVSGHHNKLVVAKVGGKTVWFFCGRCHLYEGFSAFEAAFAVGVLGELRLTNLILTNAAGGINSGFRQGDIVAISDHINLQGASPLTAISDNGKFCDMTQAYDKNWREALQREFLLKDGVYAGVLGPNYETPAEIRYLKTIGADLVGMSTVMEAIFARYYGMRVLGLSVVTNMAAGIQKTALSHSEVTDTANTAMKKLSEIIGFAVEYA